MDKYYTGTSGLVLPVPNKTHFPVAFSDKSRLHYYASLFNSIEVNSSFYKIPQAKTVAKWRDDVPENFKFTFKIWRGITHEQGLTFNPGDVHRFMTAIDPAGEKKGCLLVQLPPGARVDRLPQLMRLVNLIREADPEQSWKIALEFRHASWYNDAVQKFTEEHALTVVIQDMPASATPVDFAADDTVYLRFHGPGGDYRDSYPEEILQEYSTYIREWLEDEKQVYVYFNNTMGEAMQNLMTLNRFVKQAGD